MSDVDKSKIQKEDDYPEDGKLRKQWSFETLINKDGKWVYEKTTHIRRYDTILRKWVEEPQYDKVEYVGLEERGVKKTQTVKILVARSVPDSETFEILHAYFLYELEAKVPDSPEYEHVYLSVTPYQKHGNVEVRGTINLNYLNFNTSHIMSWTHHWVKIVGKPVKLTDEEAQKMVSNNEIADVLEKVPKAGEHIKKCVFRESL